MQVASCVQVAVVVCAVVVQVQWDSRFRSVLMVPHAEQVLLEGDYRTAAMMEVLVQHDSSLSLLGGYGIGRCLSSGTVEKMVDFSYKHRISH